MEPTLKDIHELRSEFLQLVQDEGKDFHPKDVSRAASDDSWLRRFLIHHDLDPKDALNMLVDTCEWRKTNKVNDLNETTVNREYLSEGSLFVHNRDKNGKSLFIFKCSKHVKGQKDFEELKKCVIYWFERVERQDKGDQITIFFDMTNTGLANMDMEYTSYLINLCKLYYPHFLNYILIFEMPWVLNAAFKVIKTWLPTKAVQKIKFVNKSTLKEYVDSSQALEDWGGTDPYVFSFSSESSESSENKKKVHFADGSPSTEEYDSPLSAPFNESNDSMRVKITPPDAISFNPEGIEYSGTFWITNHSEAPLTYKVKTTAPDKFRVKPSSGILTVGQCVTINVVLLSGFNSMTILRDKFLVMTLPIEQRDVKNVQVNDVWKNYDNSKLEEHKLKCRVATLAQVIQPNGTAGAAASPTSETEQKISQLLISVNHISSMCSEIDNDIRSLKRILILTLFLGICFSAFMLYIVTNFVESNDHCHADL